jgi:hypothetical protein
MKKAVKQKEEWDESHYGADLFALKELGRRLHEVLPSGVCHLDDAIQDKLVIRTKAGKNQKLQLNPVQREFSRNHRQHSIVLKARQMGISSYIAARFFIQAITRPGTLAVQVAHDQEAAEQIFRIVHRFYQNLTPRWRAGALRTSRRNIRQLVFPKLDSEYRVETAGDPNCGRGLTIQLLHCSEIASWPGDAEETMASLRAAVAVDGETVLESTPKGAGGVFYNAWQHADEMGVQKHFYPWWMEASYRVAGAKAGRLSAEEAELQRVYGLSDEQIAFRRKIGTSFRALAPQEYAESAESCFLASGDCIFDVAMLNARGHECVDPVEVGPNGDLQVWFTPQRGKHYVIGVDPAGGGAKGDYAAAQVIERESALQCAELRAHLPPRELAQELVRLARRYNHALVAVERNNHGHSVLMALENEPEPVPLFGNAGTTGWDTNQRTRPTMVYRFVEMMHREPHLFQSRRLLKECRTFIRRENGTPGAAQGTHDDCIIAMAIALAVREEVVAVPSRDGSLLLTSVPN